MVTVVCNGGFFIHCTLSKLRYYLSFPVQQFLNNGENKNLAAAITYRKLSTSLYGTYTPYDSFLLLRLLQFLMTDVGWCSLKMPSDYEKSGNFIQAFIDVLEISCNNNCNMQILPYLLAI